METRPDPDPIEARLRAAAPSPSPELRRQVLQRCQETRRHKPAVPWFGQLRLVGSLTGFLLLCWLANGWLDGQSQAIISGTDRRQPGVTRIQHTESVARMGVQGQRLLIALRWRLQQVALLLEEKYSG